MSEALDPAVVKERQRALWSMGDYAAIAEIFAPASDALVAAAGVAAGQDVLDCAAGTGNTARAAARAGARVTATDLTPHLIEIGKALTAREGLEIAWSEADVEDQPFGDESFDAVLSSFGAMFSPRPPRAAAELFRLVRPGGAVALTSWTPEGANGVLFDVAGRTMPSPPGSPMPSRWGQEAFMRDLLAPHAEDIAFSRGEVIWRFASREAMQVFNEEKVPPALAMKLALPPEVYARVIAEINERLEPFITEDDGGGISYPAEFLVTVARRSGRP